MEIKEFYINLHPKDRYNGIHILLKRPDARENADITYLMTHIASLQVRHSY